MKQYFLIQWKRLLRPLPGVLLVLVILLGCLSAVFTITAKKSILGDENQKVEVALVGAADDPFLQMGLMAVEAYDTSRLTLNIQQLTLEEAKTALARGKIAAYVTVPENFLDEALSGNVMPLDFVTTAGASNLVSIFKTEFTRVLTRIIVDAQKGTYAMAYIATDHKISTRGHMDAISIGYAEFVFFRDRMYHVENLGIADALDMTTSMMCGITVLFLSLFCLPFAPQLIRNQVHLGRMLKARGRPAFFQAAADFFTYAITLLALMGLLLCGAAVCLPGAVEPVGFWALLWRLTIISITFSATSYLLYNLVTDLVSGVLLQFFLTTALCFVSGCMYPTFFFPVGVQEAAKWLPPAAARTLLSTAVTYESHTTPLLLLLGVSLVCFLGGALRYCRRIKEVA